jgi:hypothetical protein
MPKKRKATKAKKSKKASAKKAAKITKPDYYDKFEEKPYSGSEFSVKRTLVKTNERVLKHLEKDAVKQDD